jgi:predicted HTH domain antitoxin
MNRLQRARVETAHPTAKCILTFAQGDWQKPVVNRIIQRTHKTVIKYAAEGTEVNLAIELPEDIAARLTTKWGDLSQAAREAIAIEGYRSGALSQAEVQRMLGLASRWETDALLKRAGVYLDYSEDDLTSDLEVSRRLSQK